MPNSSLSTLFTNLVVPSSPALPTAINDQQSSANAASTPLGIFVNIPQSTASANQATTYFATAQAFQMSAIGLKPSTVHYFTFNGANVSANCQPSGGVLGGALATDVSGNLNFTFYYNTGLPSTATGLASIQNTLNSLAGTKIGVLASSDNTSIAAVSITIIDNSANSYAQQGPTVGVGGGSGGTGGGGGWGFGALGFEDGVGRIMSV